ncbi:MAG: hypothetical protein DRR16_22785 [Candidatus Parabeggiatoa sp. nov. 3]|nr:MAG: hypothetical protein DRR00_28980 [Gammaproteobacteria bacterium]RKZ68492.1 MAG: hypothetical protein DRQ99_03730 [Gammaproteobacteria bacterium]RKZ81035.1 MAG: hypothetical protein DRR16_22785 [Gammaproteobacteria bacterium]
MINQWKANNPQPSRKLSYPIEFVADFLTSNCSNQLVSLLKSHFVTIKLPVPLITHLTGSSIKAFICTTLSQDFVSLLIMIIHKGLKLDSHPQRLIETQKQVKVTIRAPADALMSAKLYKDNKRLEKYLTLVQKRAGQYEIHAKFPSRFDYLFTRRWRVI